jgi:hypothetical protein
VGTETRLFGKSRVSRSNGRNSRSTQVFSPQIC